MTEVAEKQDTIPENGFQISKAELDELCGDKRSVVLRGRNLKHPTSVSYGRTISVNYEDDFYIVRVTKTIPRNGAVDVEVVFVDGVFSASPMEL